MRVIQGLGGAGMMVLVSVLIAGQRVAHFG